MRKQADLSPRLVECEPTSQVKQETAASPQAIEFSSLGASFKEPATTADPKKIVRDPKKANRVWRQNLKTPNRPISGTNLLISNLIAVSSDKS